MATLETGYPLDQLWLIGGLRAVCLVLYAIPATCVLGAIILTGFSEERSPATFEWRRHSLPR